MILMHLPRQREGDDLLVASYPHHPSVTCHATEPYQVLRWRVWCPFCRSCWFASDPDPTCAGWVVAMSAALVHSSTGHWPSPEPSHG